MGRMLPLVSPWEDTTGAWTGSDEAFERMVASCTFVVMTNREVHLQRILPHYARSPLASKLIIVWNDPTRPPPRASTPRREVGYGGRPPEVLWITPKTNDLQNRFLVYAQVETECVVSLDDDLVLPHNATGYAFAVWRGDFFAQLVGHLHYARFHEKGPGGAYHYLTNNSRQWSLALTGGGAVVHREALRHWTHPRMDPFRAHVRATQNCEDLLLNMLVTNLTGRGPVVVDAMSWPERKNAQLYDTSHLSLSNRSSHYKARDKCLGRFASGFGPHSLVLTTELFSPRTGYGPAVVPGRHHYKSSSPTKSTWVQRAGPLWYRPAQRAG
jgi:hypothetical protein